MATVVRRPARYRLREPTFSLVPRRKISGWRWLIQSLLSHTSERMVHYFRFRCTRILLGDARRSTKVAASTLEILQTMEPHLALSYLLTSRLTFSMLPVTGFEVSPEGSSSTCNPGRAASFVARQGTQKRNASNRRVQVEFGAIEWFRSESIET